MKTQLISRSLIKGIAVVAAVAGVIGQSRTEAATYTWNANRSGNWTTGSSWIGGSSPNNAGGDSLIFGSTTGSNSRSASNDFTSGYSVASLTLAGTTSYTLGGNSITLLGNITNNTNRQQTINLDIATGAPVTVSGTSSQRVSFGGTITNTNGLTFSSGKYALTNAIAGGGAVTTGSSAFVTLQASAPGGIGSLSNSGTLALGSNDGAGIMTLDVTNNVTFNSPSNLLMSVGSSGNAITPGTTFDQVVSTHTTFGGTLTMNFSGMQYDPEALVTFNTAWKLFDSAGYSGNFSSMVVTGATGDYANMNGIWTLENNVWVSPLINNSDGTQYFAFDQASGNLVVVPEPSTIVFATLGAAISGWHCLNKRRGSRKAVVA